MLISWHCCQRSALVSATCWRLCCAGGQSQTPKSTEDGRILSVKSTLESHMMPPTLSLRFKSSVYTSPQMGKNPNVQDRRASPRDKNPSGSINQSLSNHPGENYKALLGVRSSVGADVHATQLKTHQLQHPITPHPTSQPCAASTSATASVVCAAPCAASAAGPATTEATNADATTVTSLSAWCTCSQSWSSKLRRATTSSGLRSTSAAE